MERKGQVLILLVEQALSFQDYKAASMHCQELMATGEVNKLMMHEVMEVEIWVLTFVLLWGVVLQIVPFNFKITVTSC